MVHMMDHWHLLTPPAGDWSTVQWGVEVMRIFGHRRGYYTCFALLIIAVISAIAGVHCHLYKNLKLVHFKNDGTQNLSYFCD